MSIDKFILKKDDAALLVIDIQERLIAAMKDKIAEQVIKNTGILIETARIFEMPVVVSEQYRKGLGPTVEGVMQKLGDTKTLEKLHFDCCGDDNLAREISGTSKKSIIIAGIETHVCVFQTALSLLRKGYNVIIASDAVSSRRKHDWQYALAALSQAGALIYPTETIAFMILEKAGTEQFKKLAPLFK